MKWLPLLALVALLSSCVPAPAQNNNAPNLGGATASTGPGSLKTLRLLFTGDSLTTETSPLVGAANQWTTKLRQFPRFKNFQSYTNVARGAQLARLQADQWLTNTTPWRIDGKNVESGVAFVYIGMNDILLDGVDGTEAFRRFSTNCVFAMRDGYRVVGFTACSNNLKVGAIIQRMDDFNTLVRAHKGLFYHDLIDVDLLFPPAVVDSYQIDSLHFNSTGTTVLASNINATLGGFGYLESDAAPWRIASWGTNINSGVAFGPNVWVGTWPGSAGGAYGGIGNFASRSNSAYWPMFFSDGGDTLLQGRTSVGLVLNGTTLMSVDSNQRFLFQGILKTTVPNTVSNVFYPAEMFFRETSVSNATTGADENLMTCIIPANLLLNQRDHFEVTAHGQYNATANNKTVKFRLGATDLFTTGVLAANAGGWFFRIIVSRGSSANVQRVYCEWQSANALLPSTVSFTTGAENLASDLTAAVRVQDGTATGGITNNLMRVVWAPAQ